MKAIHMVAFILLVIGGLNWLLFAFGYDIGKYVPDTVAQVIYVLVGLSAVYEAVTHKTNCKACGGSGMSSM